MQNLSPASLAHPVGVADTIVELDDEALGSFLFASLSRPYPNRAQTLW